MQLPAIYRERPITAWTFTIGAIGVLIWALFSRAFAGSTQGDTTQTATFATTSNMPDPNAQLQATTQLRALEIQSGLQSRAIDAEFALETARLGVEKTLGELGYTIQDRAGERQLAALTVTEQATSDRYAVQANLLGQQLEAEKATDIALIDAQTQQTQIWAGVQTNATNKSASVEKKKSSNSLIGGIIGGIASIFSDANLKYDIRPLGRDANGLAWYTFRYLPLAAELDNRIVSGPVYTGVMAQELAGTRFAKAVGKRSGFLTVNYEALH
jgi:hypothetical protein